MDELSETELLKRELERLNRELDQASSEKHQSMDGGGLKIEVFDFTQFNLDLSTVNVRENQRAEWQVEYNFSTYYFINEISPVSLHALADEFLQENSIGITVFNKYYKANSVRVHNNPSTGCDSTCVHQHYCAVTRLEYDAFRRCMQMLPSALSASRSLAVRLVVLLVTAVSIGAALNSVR